MDAANRHERRLLACRIKSLLYELLGTTAKALRRPLVIRCRGALNDAKLMVAQRGDAMMFPDQYPGLWMSPEERLIWNTLGDGVARIGKVLAKDAGLEYDATFRWLCANLVRRRLLVNDAGSGYRRAAPEASADPQEQGQP